MSETNAERLERLKQRKSATDYLLGGTALKGDWHWLIEQAERVQELREVLAFYADSNNYQVNVVDQWGPEIKVMMDGGAKAAKLLEELK